MARSASSYSVKIEGLEEASKIPGWLDNAQRAMLDEVSQELAEAVGEASGSRRIAASFRGRALTSTRGIVESRGTAFAKARDRGAYITPRRGSVLRFADGGFARFARLKPHRYVAKGMRKRRAITEAAFERHYADIRHEAQA